MGMLNFLKKARDEKRQKAAKEAERQHKATEEAERQRILAEEERKRKAAEEAERQHKSEEAARDRAEEEKKLIEEKRYFEVDKERWRLYMRLIEEIEKIATKAATDAEAKKKSEQAEREKRLSASIASLFPKIDQELRDSAAKGYCHLKVRPSDFDDNYKPISVITKSQRDYENLFYIPGIASEDRITATAIIAEHYREEGFVTSCGYDYAQINWETEQSKQKKSNQAKLLEARIDTVQTALLLDSFVSAEGYDGNITNYVMHTIRLTYIDGKKDVISIHESDPFFYGIIDKLEN